MADFLQNNSEAILGYANVTLTPPQMGLIGKDPAVPANPKFRRYSYGQRIEDLEVHGAFARIIVRLGAPERIAYISLNIVPPPSEPLPPDVITGTDAITEIADHPLYQHLNTFTTPTLVVYEAPDRTLHRAWRFTGYEGFEEYLFLVDSNTASLLEDENLVAHSSVTGTVKGYATPGTSADTNLNPEVEMDIPGVFVKALNGGTPECPSDDGTVADEAISSVVEPVGEFDVEVSAFPARVTARLEGPWAIVHDCSNQPGQHECMALTDLPENEWAEGDLLGCAPITSANDHPVPRFNEPPHSEAETAQLGVFLAIGKTHDWFRSLQPAFDGIDEQVFGLTSASPNAAFGQAVLPPCNAFFFPGRQAVLFMESDDGVCNNFGFSMIASHEYAHFINHRIFGGFVTEQSAFNEPIADTISAFTWKEHVYAEHSFVCPGPVDSCRTCCTTFSRDLDWVDPAQPGVEADVRLGVAESLPCWCQCPDAGHCSGLALSQAFWDMRDNFKITYGVTQGEDNADQLLTDFLFVADGRLANSLISLLVADDDNATLGDMTPNHADIIESFVDRHGWPPVSDGMPDGTVDVQWVGPLTGSPVAGIDYSVHYSISPPNVVLRTTVGSDGRPVESWLVRRADSNGQALDLNVVTAIWSSPANRDIIVELGAPVEGQTTPTCNDVGIADIPAQSNNNYSSLLLTLSGDVVSRASAQPVLGTCQGGPNNTKACREPEDCPGGACNKPQNFGDGGRISGSFRYNRGVVYAQAIGLGTDAPGELRFERSGIPQNQGIDTGDVELFTIPENSVLDVDILDRECHVHGDVYGTVRIGSLINYTVLTSNFSPRYRGRVLITGDVGSTGRVEVDDPVVGVLGADIGIEGSVHGNVQVLRLASIDTGYPVFPIARAATLSTGFVSGSITVGNMVSGGGISSPAFDPVITTGTVTGTILQQPNPPNEPMSGTIQVGTEQNPESVATGGSVQVYGALAENAKIIVHGEVGEGGLVRSGGGVAGSEVAIRGNVRGTVEVLGSPAFPMNGNLVIGTGIDMSDVTGTGTVTLDTQLGSGALVTVNGSIALGGRMQLKKGLPIGTGATVSEHIKGLMEIGDSVFFGGDLAGTLTVGGTLFGTLSHYGRTTDNGTISVGSITGAGKYTQTLTNPAGPWSGSFSTLGDMAGALTFNTKLESADVVVEGAMSGLISFKGGVYDSSIALNTVGFCSHATTGEIEFGNKFTQWTPDANGIVHLGSIDIYGDFGTTPSPSSGLITFQGCKSAGSPTITAMETLCFHRHKYGQILNKICSPLPAILQCPASPTDPCEQ